MLQCFFFFIKFFSSSFFVLCFQYLLTIFFLIKSYSQQVKPLYMLQYLVCSRTTYINCMPIVSFVNMTWFNVRVIFLTFQHLLTYMNMHDHLLTLDESKIGWTPKVRVTRIWDIISNTGVFINHNMIILDCPVRFIIFNLFPYVY